jgi:hypothetical protein
MRTLTELEQRKIRVLTENHVSLTLIQPTETGLKKSILDATGSIRNFLRENQIHDYDIQLQGPENKACYKAKIYHDFTLSNSNATLYRPNTKKGDTRIWFSGLAKYTVPNDIVAIIHFDHVFHLFNLTQLNIENLLRTNIYNPFQELIAEISLKNTEVASELLAMLRKVAISGPIPSMVSADTSVGRTLEAVLGIKINSSKQPDFKGIELKSFRGSRTNRKNLFAQVPDWNLSKFKSSAEILDAFGYVRNQDIKLYCTVSAINRNSQGLSLRLDSDIKQVIENSNNSEIGDFMIWTLDKLHNRLQEKHKETFWVEAESTFMNGKEHFQYTLVEHTKKPISSQFDLLIEQGLITLDHLIKKNSAGRVIEKGPLFKIKSKGLALLFPPSEKHKLI